MIHWLLCPAQLLLRYVLLVAGFLAGLPGGYFEVRNVSWVVVGLIYVLAAGWVLAVKNRSRFNL